MRNTLYAFLLLVSCSGCTHYYYAPNMHNVPLFHEKKEFRIAGAISSGDEFSGTEVQTAYSVTDHIGLMGNFMSANGGDVNNGGEGHQLEAGAGYFMPFAEKGVFEIYGGFGGGKVMNKYDAYSNSTLKLSKYFIQPSVGYSTDYFDAAVSVRIAMLHYGSMEINNTSGMSIDDLQYISNHSNSLLYEPAITIRGGWKYIKVQTQWGYSFNSTSPDLRQEHTNFNFGLYFSFARRFEDSRKQQHRKE